MKMIAKWIYFSFIGTLVGFLLSIVLSIGWFLFSWIVLGYGDSGPEWVNILSYAVIILSFVVGFALGQVWFIAEMLSERKSSGE